MKLAVERSPTLLHGCARAATAAETRFRIPYPNSRARVSRIVALDAVATGILGRLADGPRAGSRRLTYQTHSSGPEGLPVDAVLRAPDGSQALLSDELAGVDVVVMVAGTGAAAAAAAVIGNACAARAIMTVGLVVDRNGAVDAAVSALRPHAAVLVVAATDDYIPEMLTALRA